MRFTLVKETPYRRDSKWFYESMFITNISLNTSLEDFIRQLFRNGYIPELDIYGDESIPDIEDYVSEADERNRFGYGYDKTKVKIHRIRYQVDGMNGNWCIIIRCEKYFNQQIYGTV